tara:strand:- start:108 stop:863 length:756 start_codon:yes stop_codon:yes gene_type:complete
MAISVDDVYKTVLFILNKEQRGYMPPAEFNKIATHVQREIFESYFQYENKQYRVPSNDSEYSDRYKNVDEKISELKKLSSGLTKNAGGYFEQPTDLYKIGTVIYLRPGRNDVEAQRVQENELLNINASPLTKPTLNHPIYTYRENKIFVQPTSIDTGEVSVSYLKKPSDIVWSYYIDDATGGYLWDGNGVPVNPHTGPFPASGSVDFELHQIEQTEVIIKILAYAGVIIRDPQIIQVANQLDQQETIQENT